MSLAVVTAVASFAWAGAAAAEAGGDAARGSTLFNQRCGVCHSVAVDGVKKPGPPLKNVVNRKAAAVAGFNYSPALKKSNITWTPGKLEPYLAAPAKTVPGTFMMASVSNPADRADIIAYLRTAK
jgi:cytochrome c